MIVLIIEFLFISVGAQIIYPPDIQNKIQWTQQGYWMDCQTQTMIKAQNCYDNDSKFIECYEVPESGICSQKFKIQSNIEQLYLSIKMKFISAYMDTQDLQIMFGKQFLNLQLNFQQQSGILKIPSEQLGDELSYSIKGKKPLFLIQAQLQTSNSHEGCIMYDLVTNTCTKCEELNYWMYEGQCMQKSYLNVLQSIGQYTTSYQTNESKIDYIYTNTEGVISDILIPRIYFLKGIQEPIVQEYADQDTLSLIDKNKIKLSLSYEELLKLPCLHLETSESFVTECVVSMSLSFMDINQYQHISIMRVMVSKTTNATKSLIIDTQSFSPPSECCQEQSINILGEGRIISKSKDTNYNILLVQQTIQNPSYLKYKISYNRGAIYKSDGTLIILELIKQSEVKSATITYTFRYSISLEVELLSSKIYIESTLTQPSTQLGRLLNTESTKLSNMNFTFISGQNTTSPSQIIDQAIIRVEDSNNSFYWLLAFFWIVSIIAIAMISYYKSYSVKQAKKKKDQQTSQENSLQAQKVSQKQHIDVNNPYGSQNSPFGIQQIFL